MTLSSIDTEEKRGEKMSGNRLSPRFSVCGASQDPLEIWNRVREILNPNGLVGDLKFRDAFFGDSMIDENAGDIPYLDKLNCEQSVYNSSCCLMHHCQRCISHHANRLLGDVPTVADLFSGAGGLTLGFEQAGFKSEFALDNYDWAIESYRYNRPWADNHALCLDLGEWLKDPTTVSQVDVLAGGPPCQSFSTANRQRKKEDERDYLYKLFIESIPSFKPKIVVIENVRGFEKVLPDLCDQIESLGYKTKIRKINAREFGIPQNRARIFTLAASVDYFGSEEKADLALDRIISRIIEQKKHFSSTNLIDAIGDLPALSASRIKNKTSHESDENGWSVMAHPNKANRLNVWIERINSSPDPPILIYNHKARYNNDRDIEIFGKLKPGEDSTAKSIEGIMPYSSRNHIFKDKYFKLKPDLPCKTITAHMGFDCNMYIHPNQARGLTVREAARVQGFPDNYVFCGTLHAMYKQVGNAVPPPLAKVLASAIYPEVSK